MMPRAICHCGTCKTCRHRGYQAAYYQRNRDRIVAARRARQLSDPLLRIGERHNITRDEYVALLVAQDGVCALCRDSGRTRRGNCRPLHIDHCHETGRIRGLLCGPCNTALGRLGDTAESIRRVLFYLEAGV